MDVEILAAQEHGEDMSSPDMEAPWSRVVDGRLAEIKKTGGSIAGPPGER